MLINELSQNDISLAVSEALAPAFILSAIAGLINTMTVRLNRIQDRVNVLTTITDADGQGEVVADIAYWAARARALNRCMFCLIASSVCIVAFCAVVFVSMLLSLHYERMILWIFILSLVLLFFGLCLFTKELWILIKKVN